MFFQSIRLLERTDGLEQFKNLVKDKGKALIIHYSCESFITSHGRTPRITSICVRHIASGQSKSFSIHLHCQFANKDFNNLDDKDYDNLEKQMLSDFYQYVQNHKDWRWIHWNMRDSNYGFEAIGNRYRILGGVPIDIDLDRRYDLPRILGLIYTYDYEEHKPNGKLLNLANRNGITIMDALRGDEESESFARKEYLKLHKSTLRKVDMIETIVDRTEKNRLRVKSGIVDIYGLTVPGIFEIVKNNWVLLTIWTVVVFVFGVAAEQLIQEMLSQ